MRILDIGAGIAYTNRAGRYKSPRWCPPNKEDLDGMMQYAEYRWTRRNTAEQVRKLTGTDEWLDIDGIDLEAPTRFTDEKKKLRLRGYDVNNIPDDIYPVMTWLYPNPWDVIDYKGRRIAWEYPNPLDTVRSLIPERLAPGGRLILETEMMLEPEDYDGPCLLPDPCHALLLITQTLRELLVETDEKLATDDPYRRFSRVYRKRG